MAEQQEAQPQPAGQGAPDCTEELVKECGPALAIKFQRTMGRAASNELWAAIQKDVRRTSGKVEAVKTVEAVLNFYLGPGPGYRQHRIPRITVHAMRAIGIPPQAQAARAREAQLREPVPVTRQQTRRGGSRRRRKGWRQPTSSRKPR